MHGYFSQVIYRPTRLTAGAPFGLRSVGHARFRPGHSESRRVVDFVQLLWSARGRGGLERNGKDYALEPGEAFCFRPGMRHRVFARETAWECRWLTVDGPCAAGIVLGLGLPDESFAVGPDWAAGFAAQARALRRVGPREQVEATAGLYAFLVEFAGRVAAGRAVGPERNETVEQAKALMLARLSDAGLGVRQIAAEVGLERTTFARVFHQATGVTAKAYLDDLRLQSVLTKLKSSAQSVTEIAREAGFGSANYLAKFLRRKLGVSPSEFRARSG